MTISRIRIDCVLTDLFVLNILVFIMILVLVMRPLQHFISCIKEGRLMEAVGSYEFRYLAMTYNDIFEANATSQELLRYRAEHDTLTGISNRDSFDRLREIMKSGTTPVALLLMDVDEYRKINDGYGRDTGDLVLKKVAKVLQDQFRTSDYIARIGGDEFAVIMTDITPELKDAIVNKLVSIGTELGKTRDGFPKVTISTGIAFSPAGMDDSTYQKADRALCYVKEYSRSGYKFYDEL